MVMVSDLMSRLTLVFITLVASLLTGCAATELFLGSCQEKDAPKHLVLDETTLPRQFDTQWKAAYALLESGHYERCLERIQQMESDWPNHRKVRLLKAEAYVANEDYDLAAALYRDLLDTNPEDQELRQLYEVSVELSQTTRQVDTSELELQTLEN